MSYVKAIIQLSNGQPFYLFKTLMFIEWLWLMLSLNYITSHKCTLLNNVNLHPTSLQCTALSRWQRFSQSYAPKKLWSSLIYKDETRQKSNVRLPKCPWTIILRSEALRCESQLAHSSFMQGQVWFVWEKRIRKERTTIVHQVWEAPDSSDDPEKPHDFPRLKCLNTSPLHVLVVQVRWVHGKKQQTIIFPVKVYFHLTFSNKKREFLLPHVIPELS